MNALIADYLAGPQKLREAIQEKRAAMGAGDKVQESSEESFPASDPPEWTELTRQ